MQNHSALQAEESRSYQTSKLNATPAPNLNQIIVVVRILELSMASPAFPSMASPAFPLSKKTFLALAPQIIALISGYPTPVFGR